MSSFTERNPVRNDCHFPRVMREDGRDARDAPWQLPCRRGPRVTKKVELLPVPGGAVLVWTQHSELDPETLAPGPDYEEGVFAVLLTPEGQRGSEILRVTDDAATTISSEPLVGPLSGELAASAGGDGNAIGVTWMDVRRGVPEVYVRRIECVVGEWRLRGR